MSEFDDEKKILASYFYKSIEPKLMFQNDYFFMEFDGVAIPYDKEFIEHILPSYEYCEHKLRRSNINFIHYMINPFSFHDLWFISSRKYQPELQNAMRNIFKFKYFDFVWNPVNSTGNNSRARNKIFTLMLIINHLYKTKKNFNFAYLDCNKIASLSLLIQIMKTFKDDQSLSISFSKFNRVHGTYIVEVKK